MAVERTTKEFELNLGEMVRTRLSSFVNVRKGIQAKEEAEFQRSIIDNDLSYDDQLSYRKGQLDKEQGKQYPDNNFITEIKTSITYNKKMVRHRKFRDSYFSFLEEYVSGKKSLDDHLNFLEDKKNDSLSEDIKNEIQNKIIEVKNLKRKQDLDIIEAQVSFSMKDRTSALLQESIDLIKKQLVKPETQKDESLKLSYQYQLQTLEKGLTEVKLEDKVHNMAISLVGKEMAKTSLWKVNTFANFRDNSGIDTPINIGGVKYDSEQAYWSETLDNYIKNDFTNDYVDENKREAVLLKNQIGYITNDYLRDLSTENIKIKSHKELQDYQQIILSAVQGSVIESMNLKSQDLIDEYYLDSSNLAISSDYKNAMKELEDLKILFGEDYSLSPLIKAIETKLISYEAGRTGEALSDVNEWKQSVYENTGKYPTEEETQEYLKTQGVITSYEVPAEEHLKGEPHERAEKVIKESEQYPEQYAEKERLEKEEMEEKVRLAKEKKEAETTTPKFRDTRVNPQTGQKEIYGQQGTWNPVYPVDKTGQIVKPKVEPTIPTTPTGYVVKSGETLWGIAQKQLGSGSRWKELGYTGDPSKLQVGQKLTIPQK